MIILCIINEKKYDLNLMKRLICSILWVLTVRFNCDISKLFIYLKNKSLLENNFMCYIVIFQKKNNVFRQYISSDLPTYIKWSTEFNQMIRLIFWSTRDHAYCLKMRPMLNNIFIDYKVIFLKNKCNLPIYIKWSANLY